MTRKEQAEYHSERAREELSKGFVANGLAAARAHLGLSYLHRERARQLSEGQKAAPPLVM